MSTKPNFPLPLRWTAILGVGACLLCIGLSAPLSEGIRHGLSLCVQAVIPSVFPSMIVSDALLCERAWVERSWLGHIFARVFHLPPAAAVAYLLGLCTGFPVGMRVCAELYRDGVLTRQECERLMCFCNNTGPAFLIAGIGGGLYGDVRIGAALYLCQLLVSAGIGVLLGRGKPYTHTAHKPSPCVFCLVDSVRDASLSCVYIGGFVSMFSAVAYLAQHMLPQGMCVLLLPLLEIGSAASYLGHTSIDILHLSATAFAVGFSGLSVHMQSMVFFKDLPISTGPYYSAKLAAGVLCACLFLPLAAAFCR